MRTEIITLNTIDKVKSFVNEASAIAADIDLISGRYVIDAKSIMGIFSLDLSKPIEIRLSLVNSDDEKMEIEKFNKLVEKYSA